VGVPAGASQTSSFLGSGETASPLRGHASLLSLLCSKVLAQPGQLLVDVLALVGIVTHLDGRSPLP
jgi:hypothetical protein